MADTRPPPVPPRNPFARGLVLGGIERPTPAPTGTHTAGVSDNAREARREIRAAERDLQELLPGRTAQELAPGVALKAMRVLERGLNDYDPRVAFEAARVVVTSSHRVAEMVTQVAETPADPEARRSAMLAALTSDEAIALVLEVVRSSEAPLRVALEAAGWVHGDDS